MSMTAAGGLIALDGAGQYAVTAGWKSMPCSSAESAWASGVMTVEGWAWSGGLEAVERLERLVEERLLDLRALGVDRAGQEVPGLVVPLAGDAGDGLPVDDDAPSCASARSWCGRCRRTPTGRRSVRACRSGWW
jgi:hypothetical protein